MIDDPDYDKYINSKQVKNIEISVDEHIERTASAPREEVEDDGDWKHPYERY